MSTFYRPTKSLGGSVSLTVSPETITMQIAPTLDSSFVIATRSYLTTSGVVSDSPVGVGVGSIAVGPDQDSRCFGTTLTDPETGADLSRVSLAGVKQLLLLMFSTAYAETTA